jgi:hypothetical protein
MGLSTSSFNIGFVLQFLLTLLARFRLGSALVKFLGEGKILLVILIEVLRDPHHRNRVLVILTLLVCVLGVEVLSQSDWLAQLLEPLVLLLLVEN